MACSSASIKHVILTGPPGVGKTTLIHKVCQALQHHRIPMQGFYTEEQREKGLRVGFDVVTLDGQRGPLARIKDGSQLQSRCFVGQYAVCVTLFEQLAIPVLTEQRSEMLVCVIDEIGKMELFSKSFVKAVSEIFSASNFTVLASIPTKRQNPIRFVEDIRSRMDVKLFEISKDNRDSVLNEIVEVVISAYNSRQRK